MSEIPEYLRGTALGEKLYGASATIQQAIGLAARFPEVAAQVQVGLAAEADAYEALMMPVTDLKAACETMGITQSALADALGVSKPFVSQMIGGTKPLDKRTDLAVRALLAAHIFGGK